jgi:transcriptional regulator with XRE-family HTH domain
VTQNEKHPEARPPHRVIAERVKDIRRRRKMTAARLGEEMTKAGIPWDRSIVANLESGRRKSVSVEELLGLAYVLDVAPIHLIVPLDEGRYAVTPGGHTARNHQVRAWIRGTHALEGHTDERYYFSEVPVEEWTAAKIRAQVDALGPEDRADHEATKSAMLADVKRLDQQDTTTGHEGEQR